MPEEQQLTHASYNHILTNVGVWSHDGAWIYYDVRSDPAGAQFDGQRIERVCAETGVVEAGTVETVYESKHGACCGVVTASPLDDSIVFIEGPENPTPDWSYAAWHRHGLIATRASSESPAVLDARNLAAAYTPGALRGGTHLHVFSGDGQWVSFTYEDAVLETSQRPGSQKNQRNVGVAVLGDPVEVPRTNPRNHDGAAFCALVTQTVDSPTPGSDEISRAYSDAWVGKDGYRQSDGQQQQRAIAFLGDVIAEDGATFPELFLVDIPNDVTVAGTRPLEGTPMTRPAPPAETVQRRLTFTSDRKFPGVGGVRYWPRSSPDGSRIAFLMKDTVGAVQLWTISPNGGPCRQLTKNVFSIESAFTWRHDGQAIACVAGGSVCQIDAETGETTRLTTKSLGKNRPRPEACVYSPSGQQIAYVRAIATESDTNNSNRFNQIFVVQAFP